MKNFITLIMLCFACYAAQGQDKFTYKIKADSVKITNDSCSAELILENSTKNINGFLYNRGNGRTEFRPATAHGIDDVLAVGQPLSAHRKITGVNLYNLSIDSANFIVRGVIGTGQEVSPYSEAQMYFNPSRAAFRAGLSQWWDNSTGIGWYSAAFGARTKATNTSAFAIGTDASATGEHSFAGGWQSTASGWISFSHGYLTLASNQMSQAFGLGSISSGYVSTSFGNSHASGTYSSSFGAGTKSKSYAGTVIGFANDSTNATSQTTFNALNRAFQIGIGTADNARANAMTVLFNGNVGIGPVAPSALVHIGASTTSRASLRLDDGTAPSSPNNGDVWHASNHLYARLNGTTIQLDGQASPSWGLSGNTGTNPSTNFLGTTDNQSLVFKTNNVERMRINATNGSTDGFVGIGVSAPASILHLYGVNPLLTIEGDNVSSYYPGIVIKSVLPSGTINSYGITSAYNGGLHIYSATAVGRNVEIASSSSGNVSLSNDSTLITHRVIGAIRQATDIFDVSNNTATLSGLVSPDPFFAVRQTGKIVFNKYKNNGSEDSALSTDVNGVVKLRSWSSAISSNAWGLTGNTGTSPSTNFIGTTDNNPLLFNTNNTERMRIFGNGNIGINTTSPTTKLHVAGTGLFTDTLTATTMATGDSSNRAATTAYVKRQIPITDSTLKFQGGQLGVKVDTVLSNYVRNYRNNWAEIFDEFWDATGEMGSDWAGTGSQVVGLATTEANHPGLLKLETGTQANGRAVTMSYFVPVYTGSGQCYYETQVSIPALSTSTQRFQLVCGLFLSYGGLSQDKGVYFLYDEGGISGSPFSAASYWQTCTANGAASKTANTSLTQVTVAANTWAKLRIYLDYVSGTAAFYINGTLVSTHNTNLPSGTALTFGVGLFKSTGTSSRTVTLDYVSLQRHFATAR